jgi:hypothetical protein
VIKVDDGTPINAPLWGEATLATRCLFRLIYSFNAATELSTDLYFANLKITATKD